MRRWSSAAVACGVGCVGLFASAPVLPGASTDADASPAPDIWVRVTPSHGLSNGQPVAVSGHGLLRASGGAPMEWFILECTAAVQGRMNPDTDTAHCDVTGAQIIRMSKKGSFATTFRVVTGIVGDGYCGTLGHQVCVLAVSTASGHGNVVHIEFKAPPAPPGSPAAGSTPTSPP